jgi:hypothetical protein
MDYLKEAPMFNDLSSMEINCDAPPYTIVEACRMIGLDNPEDVRWCRLRHVPNTRFPHVPWKTFFHLSVSGEAARCCCRAEMPALERYTFSLASGKQLDYLIGQCPRCRTVIWEEA